jgi:hypothetical protein
MDADPEYLIWCVARDVIDLDHKIISHMEQLNPWMKQHPLDSIKTEYLEF